MSADEIFVSNCILGVAPVTKIQDAQFPIGNMTRRIQEKLGQCVKKFLFAVVVLGAIALGGFLQVKWIKTNYRSAVEY